MILLYIEMQVNNLPFDIQNKIFYFLEHPTAAIVKKSAEFLNIKYKERNTHAARLIEDRSVLL